jgi:rhamnosyltransferase
MPRAVVIMRTKNSDWVVDQALAGLFAQQYRDFEVLVVDSGSTDRTLEMVRKYPVTLHQIAPEKYVPGIVLNEAIARTDAEIIVFQNSDVVPLGPSSLGRLLAAFDDLSVDAAFARQVPRPEADAWVRRDYAEAFPEAGEAPPWMTYSLPLAAMRRSAWEQQPFHEDVWASEDSAWGARARARGAQVRYVADALVMHSHNYALKEIYGRRFVEGEADAFIAPGAYGALDATRRYAASLGRDLAYCARAGDVRGLLAAPARRLAYQLGYLEGRAHGQRRIATGSGDVRHAQSVVLDRFGGAGASERR